MILDTSAIVALVLAESGHAALERKIRDADLVAVGAATLVEAGIVLESKGKLDARALLERLLADLDAVVLPFGEEHWREAIDAFRRFGRGRHRAGLNFGDCLSYAAARLSGEPLLFVGEDFGRTDIEPA